MNQIKIGAFIKLKRSEKGLTQSQLAQKLGVTDRAVSKWENGRGLPDVTLMLPLCEELNISVNELLCGEEIEMENLENKTNNLLLEMTEKEIKHNRRQMLAMWTISIVGVVFYIGILLVAGIYLEKQNPTVFSVVVIVSTLLFLIAGFIAFKLEVETGYYKCKNCGHKIIPTYMSALNTMHIGLTRYLKCPNCKKRTWCKKHIK